MLDKGQIRMRQIRRDGLRVAVFGATLGLVFLLGHRVNAADPNGTSCTTDDDCTSNVCDPNDSVCCGAGQMDCSNGTDCDTNDDCDSEICDANNAVCCGDGQSDCTNGTDCQLTDDCISGRCDDNTDTCCGDGKGDCTEGSRCSVNEDCQSGKCDVDDTGRCIAGPVVPPTPPVPARQAPALSHDALLGLGALLGAAGWLQIRRRRSA